MNATFDEKLVQCGSASGPGGAVGSKDAACDESPVPPVSGVFVGDGVAKQSTRFECRIGRATWTMILPARAGGKVGWKILINKFTEGGMNLFLLLVKAQFERIPYFLWSDTPPLW